MVLYNWQVSDIIIDVNKKYLSVVVWVNLYSHCINFVHTIGVGSTGAPGAGAPLYFFQLTSILVHLLQALIVSDVQKLRSPP